MKVFSDADIVTARSIVKRAGTMVHNPIQYNSVGDFDSWLGPKSVLDPIEPKRPGFWSSLGKTTLGTLGGLGGDRVRSFFGASPGPSTVRGIASYAPLWAYGKVTGNTADVARAGRGLSSSFSVPYEAARRQSRPSQFAVADYMSREHPGVTSAVTQPIRSLKEWIEAPGPFDDKPKKPLPSTLIQPRKPFVPPVQ